MKFNHFEKKLKSFIHKHETLDKLAFFILGLWWVIRAKIIFRKIKKKTLEPFISQGAKKNKALILAVRTIPSTNLVYFDALFGHAFRKLGCQVRMLYCDGLLDSCDADTAFRNQKAQCFACKKLGPLVKNSLGLDCISYREQISDSDIQEIKEKVAALKVEQLLNYQYLGVKVGSHARASTVRFFLFGKMDLSNPEEEAVFRRKLVYAMIAAKIASKLYLKERPDFVFTLHGIYSTWGPFFEYFRKKKIEVLVYGIMSFRFGHFVFSRNNKEVDLIGPKSWEDFKKKPLSEQEEAQIDGYLSARFKGDMGELEMFRKNFNDFSEKETILSSLSNRKYLRRYVLFPNLSWDSSVGGQSLNIFKDMFAWIDQMINYFKEKPNYQLIIKPHPAELVWEKESKRVADYILTHHPNLPENIIVLKADVPLRAYDLVAPETICLVYSGTLGLELAIQENPVLNAAGSHYSDAGIVYPVKSLEEYLSLVDNPDKLISFVKSNQKLAKKYAYFYFFKSIIRVPFYRDDKWSTIDWKVVADVKKLLGDKSNLIKICQKIINKEEIVFS